MYHVSLSANFSNYQVFISLKICTYSDLPKACILGSGSAYTELT
jgi:hypothetical protein